MRFRSPWTLVIAGSVSFCLPLFAGVLPEDRADLLYHAYDGGGVEISGPSLLARKQIGQSLSAYGNYYVDSISGASIDVVTAATSYTEERREKSLGLDYLHGKSLLSAFYTNSSENDYEADTWGFSVSHDMFGDLTTVSLGYVRNDNLIGRSDLAEFEESSESQRYRIGLTQVLSKNLIASLSWETITDEGYLQNPYRSIRVLNPSDPTDWVLAPERYPRTRTSNAGAVRARYFLPWRGAVHAEYRRFADSWGIDADNYEIGYTHTWKDRWIFEVKYRHYAQQAADFYADLFPSADYQNFLARDKELSTYTTNTIGLGLSYEFLRGGWGFIDKGSLNLAYDRIRFDYEDFRDATAGGYLPGEEPLYSFTADVIQVYLSLWY